MAEITEAGVGLAGLAQHMDPLVDRLQAEWLWLGDAAQGASVFPYGPLEDMQNALWSCKGARADTARLAGRALQASANYAATETRAAEGPEHKGLGALGSLDPGCRPRHGTGKGQAGGAA